MNLNLQKHSEDMQNVQIATGLFFSFVAILGVAVVNAQVHSKERENKLGTQHLQEGAYSHIQLILSNIIIHLKLCFWAFGK